MRSLFLTLVLLQMSEAQTSSSASAGGTPGILALQVPLHFEPNTDRMDPNTKFLTRTKDYTLKLSDTSIALSSRAGLFALRIPRTMPQGSEALTARSNYYLGADPSQWRTGVPNYGRVRYAGVFRGVNLEIHGRGGEVEYDWVVNPGADPRAIYFSIEGAHGSLDSGGNLDLMTAQGIVRQTRPHAYQAGREIPVQFLLRDDQIRFLVGDYDTSRPLLIDPVLVVNTSFGGSAIQVNLPGAHGSLSDTGTGIATDSVGNIYVTGTAFSTNFPLVNPIGNSAPSPCTGVCGFQSIFVTKLTPDGKTLLYSTYIGTPLTSSPGVLPTLLTPALAVDPSGIAYLTGAASGANFPGVAATAGGMDAFVMRINPAGQWMSTLLLGGSGDDAGTSIALGTAGAVYLAGITHSSDFPVSPGAYRTPAPGSTNVFAAKITFAAGMSGTVSYSLLAGPGNTATVSVDAGGNAYLAASATSNSWQTTRGVFQPICAGQNCSDIVLAKFDPQGKQLIYCTYLGGSQTETLGGARVDSSGDLYVAGSTNSSDFPVSESAFQTQFPTKSASGGFTGFVAKLNQYGTGLTYSTYFGASGSDQALSLAVDPAGNAYVGGSTTSPNLPVSHPVQATPVNGSCSIYTPSGTTPNGEVACARGGFLAVLNPSGTGILWSTYLGSSALKALALDAGGNVYAAGTVVPQTGLTTASVGVVKLSPASPVAELSSNPVFNAATFAPGLPLPGGLASLFLGGVDLPSAILPGNSPLPTSVAGLSILIDGIAAPILALVPQADGRAQVNFQIPFEAASNVMEIRYNGTSVFAIPQTAPPGIFVLSDGTPAIQHAADYSLVTAANPVHAGETIIVYATGLGKVSLPTANGVAAPGANPAVTSCSQITSIALSSFSSGAILPLYAGLTPGAIGLYQLNVPIPANTAPGTVTLKIQQPLCTLLPFGVLVSPAVTFNVQ
jgi:uncharacterized protein (TIGR03437 family)